MSDHLDAVGRLAEVLRSTSSGVVSVQGRGAAAFTAAAAAAQLCVEDGSVDPSDVREVSPAAERWKVAEVSDEITRPVASSPLGRCWVIVVTDAAAMNPDGFTRLLRTFEEPPSPAWFVLCCDPFDLPAALRGRLTADTVQVAGSDETVFAAAVDAAGVTGDVAGLCSFSSLRFSTVPAAACANWCDTVRQVAGHLRPKAVAVWQREIASAALDSWEEALLPTLREMSSSQLRSAARFAAACADARRDLRVNVAVPSAVLDVFVAAAEMTANPEDSNPS